MDPQPWAETKETSNLEISKTTSLTTITKSQYCPSHPHFQFLSDPVFFLYFHDVGYVRLFRRNELGPDMITERVAQASSDPRICEPSAFSFSGRTGKPCVPTISAELQCAFSLLAFVFAARKLDSPI
jgi:hypothetical protein